MTWFYFSFTDPDLPEGEQFLGGLYIDGADLADALTRSHGLGVNPGGQVAVVEIPAEAQEQMDANVPEDMRRRLLTKEEVRSC